MAFPEPRNVHHEDRLRIVCHLPIDNDGEERAVGAVFEYLKNLREHQPFLSVEMFVSSQTYPSVYVGYFWSERHQQWVRAKFVICIVDYKLAELSGPAAKVSELRRHIQGLYEYNTGQIEERFWLVAHTVTRHE
jgi:hypothetical protein